MIFNQGLPRKLRRLTCFIICASAVVTLSVTLTCQWKKARREHAIVHFLQEYSRACLRDSQIQRNSLPVSKNFCPCLPSSHESLNIDRLENPDSHLPVGEPSIHIDETGGAWHPRDCVSRYHLAIIVPYRNREGHLNILVDYLHPFLQRQNIAYQIFVIEQAAPVIFNRASLMNVGFKEALARSSFDCFIFHDVDLLPEDGRSIYSCQFAPLHLGAYMNKFNYRTPYSTFFGGAIALTRDQVKTINGFSNAYYGWGGEDDDSYIRLQQNNLTVNRYPKVIGRSYMIKHEQDEGNPTSAKRDAAYNTSLHYYTNDGLNSLQYTVLKSVNHKHYTLISVNLERKKRIECIVNSSLPASSPNNYIECLDNVTNYETGHLDCCRSHDMSRVYCCRLFPLSTSGIIEEPTFRQNIERKVLPACLILVAFSLLLRKCYAVWTTKSLRPVLGAGHHLSGR